VTSVKDVAPLHFGRTFTRRWGASGDEILGGVSHYHSHCHLAKFCGSLIKGVLWSRAWLE